MKNLVFLLTFLLLLSFTDKGKHWYNSKNYRCKYHTNEGRLDGKYTSFYNNGKKKAQGLFNNNNRTGIWSVWDEKGKLMLQRNYSNPFEFTILYPAIAKNPKSGYKFERDSIGCYKHPDIYPEKILAAFRKWRIIEPAFNPSLFEDSRLFLLVNDLVIKQKVRVYTDDSLKGIKKIADMNDREFRVVAFKTMEDWFVDDDRLTAEKYTVAISPMVVYKNTTDTISFYWLELNELRPFLVKERLHSPLLPETIRNLDDVFFLHYFHGRINKSFHFAEDHTHYLQIYDPVNEALRIELDAIDYEHRLWVELLNKQQ
ncbi:MAG: hypothetical protein WC760_00905 [Bacteroidia bacterium]|jgi:hypothetical protein